MVAQVSAETAEAEARAESATENTRMVNDSTQIEQAWNAAYIYGQRSTISEKEEA